MRWLCRELPQRSGCWCYRSSLSCVFVFVCVDDSDSVEGASALRAEGVNVSVLRLCSARAIDLVHRHKVRKLRGSTIDAVVRGQELVESLHHVRDECGGVFAADADEDVAEDADSKVTLE